MKYMLLIHQNYTRDEVAALPEADQKALWAEWAAFSQTPGLTPGVELESASAATTVRVSDGETLITDGPFAQTKEALGGWFLLDADDLDAAIEVAARVPAARRGGAIEVRPVVER
ncbi:MAG: hypothetical protein QOD81_2648 [Solirubrobacteraceae bacterium]|jgi:hypothetical protein|nr:hypothetical protein [Solirubrobacteraceae bacterium]